MKIFDKCHAPACAMLTILSVKTGSDFCCWDEPEKLEFWLLCFWLLLWWLLLLLLYHHCDHDYSHNHLRVYCFVFAMYFFMFEIFILIFFLLLKAKWTNKPHFSLMLYNGFGCTLSDVTGFLIWGTTYTKPSGFSPPSNTSTSRGHPESLAVMKLKREHG